MTKEKPTLLIDGDVALYHCTKAVEEEYHWGNDLWSLVSDAGEAKTILQAWVRNIQENTGGERVVMALSGTNNWRKEILPTYKLHRKVHRKPLAFLPMKEYIQDNFETYSFDNLEGDDVLGLLAGSYQDIQGEKIIVTIDKDLRTIPGKHYNPQKADEGVVEVDEKEADYNHLLQTLMGDATDGYRGCPGIGPKRAARFLSTPTWEVVVEVYENAGLCEEEALVQARVARILRDGEYDIENEEVLLWTPKEYAHEQG